jgi:hypothetical protein
MATAAVAGKYPGGIRAGDVAGLTGQV